ncbi:MAG: (2Fe-2S)-binding protein [Deltaproteobacteria bacterium]|nr:MAG: (2Fe-2S)-binding protein [Deltaproteobacteria bacterium]
MSDITLKINGTEVTVEAGTMVLDAARKAGAEIPTLCNLEGLEPFGACRLCVVEIVRGGRSRIVASCLYPVENGIDVLTESEKVVRYRRTILELLKARWPLIDKKLLEKYGVPADRMVPRDNFCIMCGICVRHCSERRKENVLGFVGRGIERQVVSYTVRAKKVCPECFDKELSCLRFCPTGVIVNDCATVCPASRDEEAFAKPVRVRDDDNAAAVKKSLGDA